MLKLGQPIGDENLKKIDTLKTTIYELLRSQRMTLPQLTKCLMNEPDNANPDNLDLIAMAIGCLQDRRLLDCDFRPDLKGFTIEPLFRTLPLSQGTR